MKRLKRSALLGAVLTVSLLALSGCTQNNTPAQTDAPPPSATTPGDGGVQSSDLLSRIQEKGELVIAMEGTWAPWTYHNESDALVGFDVEVARSIAEKLGVTATFVEGEETATLRGAIDQALSELAADGTLTALSNQYFGTDITQNQQSNVSVER